MKAIGWILIAAGLAGMAFGLVYDPSVIGEGYDRIINIGLVTEKQMIFGAGSTLFLSGSIFAAVGSVIDILSPTKAKPTDIADDQY